MPSIYEMRQPKEKVDWRDIVDLLEKGFSVYAGLKQLGLQGDQEKRLSAQDEWTRGRAEQLDAAAAAAAEAEAADALLKGRERFGESVTDLFKEGYRQRGPAMQDVDPDFAASLMASGDLPRGALAEAQIPEYQPGMSALDLIGGTLIPPAEETPEQKMQNRFTEHKMTRDYDIAHPYPTQTAGAGGAAGGRTMTPNQFATLRAGGKIRPATDGEEGAFMGPDNSLWTIAEKDRGDRAMERFNLGYKPTIDAAGLGGFMGGEGTPEQLWNAAEKQGATMKLMSSGLAPDEANEIVLAVRDAQANPTGEGRWKLAQLFSKYEQQYAGNQDIINAILDYGLVNLSQ